MDLALAFGELPGVEIEGKRAKADFHGTSLAKTCVVPGNLLRLWIGRPISYSTMVNRTIAQKIAGATVGVLAVTASACGSTSPAKPSATPETLTVKAMLPDTGPTEGLVTVRITARRYPIPFGPFLALGALLCLFLDPQTFAWLMPWT